MQPGIPPGMQQDPVLGGYGQSVGQSEALTLMPGDQRLYPTRHDDVQTMYDQSIGQFGALPPSPYAQGHTLRTASPSHYAYPMQSGMQPGMNPGMQSGMQPGMHLGMQSGMQPGMQPGILAGMQQGSVPGSYGKSVGLSVSESAMRAKQANEVKEAIGASQSQERTRCPVERRGIERTETVPSAIEEDMDNSWTMRDEQRQKRYQIRAREPFF